MSGLRQLFIALFLSLLSVASLAVEIIGSPEIIPADTTATLRWKTDVACGTRAQFGLDASALNRKAEGPVAATHELKLENLKPGTLYHFSVGSARVDLAKGSFTTTGGTPKAPAAAAPPPPSVMRRVLDALIPEKKAPASSSSTVTAKPRAPSASTSTLTAPPTRSTWGSIDSLQDHFERHGPDFQSRSADEYAAQAWTFSPACSDRGPPHEDRRHRRHPPRL
ncbi:MAG: fibronectin type III domain-containing protein [Verrucomicrobiaceae bacterium]|nr:fibronectin type III domain-containing protein [Verrucomicrobiaceae bacterium]